MRAYVSMLLECARVSHSVPQRCRSPVAARDPFYRSECLDRLDNFKGPADLCAFPNTKGLMVVVPDLVKSELRMVQLPK